MYFFSRKFLNNISKKLTYSVSKFFKHYFKKVTVIFRFSEFGTRISKKKVQSFFENCQLVHISKKLSHFIFREFSTRLLKRLPYYIFKKILTRLSKTLPSFIFGKFSSRLLKKWPSFIFWKFSTRLSKKLPSFFKVFGRVEKSYRLFFVRVG